MIIIVYFSGCNSHKNNDTETVKVPIENITLNMSSKALELGDTIKIDAELTPSNTDDFLVWSTTNPNVLNFEHGNIKAVGVGEASIVAKANSGKIQSSLSFKVMPKSRGIEDINICKSITSPAILTITNKCYNTFLGIEIKSETKTFTATIVGEKASSYFFVTGFSNFKLIDGYSYQKWTATDYLGRTYEINNIKTNNRGQIGNDYAIAVGSINSSGLSVMPISNKGRYYEDERLFIKTDSTFTKSYMHKTTLSSSPVPAEIIYKDNLYGAPVLDCEFYFVGFVIRGSGYLGCSDFVADWVIRDALKDLNISN